MNEQEKFLESVEEASIVDQPITQDDAVPTAIEEQKGEDDDTDLKLRNRREKRLAEKLQAERESNIALNARLQAIAESKQSREEGDTRNYLKAVERIYGSASPEATEATELLKDALKGLEEQAVARAVEKLREEQQQSSAALREDEQRLDSFVEEIEDEFNLTLTEDQQKGFFKMMERASPKDANGNIIEYADPLFVWERYQEKLQRPTNTQAKNLSSRSMTQGSVGDNSKVVADAELKFLRENGII